MNTSDYNQDCFDLDLLDKEVHLWQANLNISSSEIEKLTNVLSSDEKLRANRFKFIQHQNRFIAARGFLRQIISYYLQIPCQNIIFNYSDRGKPSLLDNSLQFNVSHSQDFALYGITKNKLIGIDVEYIRDNADCNKIAQRFFNTCEYQQIENLEPHQRATAFFKLWTIKEAYLKATGEGLIGGLDTVQVAIEEVESAKITAISQQKTNVNNWFFSSFVPQEDFIATVAVKNERQPLIIKQFTLN